MNETIIVLSKKNSRKIQLVIVTKHATQYYVVLLDIYTWSKNANTYIVMINTKFGTVVHLAHS